MSSSILLKYYLNNLWPSLYKLIIKISVLYLGFFPPLQSLILVRYLGLQRLTTAFGILSMVKGLATVAGPPLAGTHPLP